jgi:hypothetical protein
MTGQFSDFLAAHAERVADVMRRAGAEHDGRSSSADRGPRQFINSVLVALTADDLRPLIAFFELSGEKPTGIDHRLESALSRLAALRRAVVEVAAAEVDTAEQVSLSGAAAEETGLIGRRLAAAVTASLASEAVTAVPR